MPVNFFSEPKKIDNIMLVARVSLPKNQKQNKAPNKLEVIKARNTCKCRQCHSKSTWLTLSIRICNCQSNSLIRGEESELLK